MKNYYLGLDIGTDSVGYAVTDDKYNLLKFKGRPVWGTTIFDKASNKAERRALRLGRRRLDRRQQRVQLIQELFAPEIAKIDKDFYLRIKASALYKDDSECRYSLFNDENFTDKDYYEKYPTIHHLIYDLMTDNNPHDVRLVYIACAWLAAHRGHFLSNIDKNQLGDIKDFKVIYGNFLNFFTENGYELPWESVSIDELGEIIKKRAGVTDKYKSLVALLFGEQKPSKEATDSFPFSREAILKLLAGGTCKLQKVFDKEEYDDKGSVSLGMDDDKMATIMSDIGDDYALIGELKAIYDWSILANVLGDSVTVSEAKVATYEQHKADLSFLKSMIKKYRPEKYDDIFRNVDKSKNYPAYAYHTNEEKCELKKANKEDFSKFVFGIAEDIEPDEEDRASYNDMMERLEYQTFLPKQKNTDNRVIPHQLFWHELKTILDTAEKYLPFLKEKDDSSMTISEKIESVFLFRIPYFVGPLDPRFEHAWIIRSHEKIYPWNFEEVVDLDASEQAFIRRMTNTCTYLPGEDVLPKDSLCYHKFMVLNEINNITINDLKISVELKQRLYNELFMNVKNVTRKKLTNYLIINNIIQKGEEDSVKGVDKTINSNLAPQIAFKQLMQNGTLTEADIERIIERSSYSNDKSRLRRFLDREYPNLSEEDKKYITNIKISGFGRLSRKLLTELKGCDKTGEVMTIMDALWNTQDNLMEILSERYTFWKEITEIIAQYYDDHKKTLSDRLDDMYISNSVKRPIFRAMDIVSDITKAFGKPQKIFIETTRSADNNQKGKRTKSRKQQILDLYKGCKKSKAEDIKVLKEQLEALGENADNQLQSDSLYLYFTQFGRCMYTGNHIILEKLGTEEYNIDHIYPQAFIKDDSIINNKVLVLSNKNGEKSDIYPLSDTIRQNMADFWKYLKSAKAISEEKYNRLTRCTPFTAEEKYNFINRQITETSQAIKAVTTVLREKLPDTEIVYSKAAPVSDFRQQFDILKSRSFNDLHHAVDAYLNIVVGNVYNMKFTKKWFLANSNYSIKTQTVFTRPVIINGQTVWDGEEMLTKVKKTAIRNDAHLTKYSFFKTGKLFDQQPVSATKSKSLIPKKKDLPTEIYGGYNGSSVMFFIPVGYSDKKKMDIIIMSVELSVGKRFLEDISFAKEYSYSRLKKILGKDVTNITFPMGMRPLKVNTVLSLDGFRVCISGSSNCGKCLVAQPLVQLSESYEWQYYTKKLERLYEKAKSNSNYIYSAKYDEVTAEKNIELYDILTDKLRNSIYRLRPNNPIDILLKGRDKFINLDVMKQTECLTNILMVFGKIAGGCNLSHIGGGTSAASTGGFSSIVSNWGKNYNCVQIINTSPSGLWEKKSENLLKLL